MPPDTNTTLAPTGPPLNSGKNVEAPSREKQLQKLVEQIATVSDQNTRALFDECLQSVLALYGDGLARILQLVSNAGPDGKAVFDALIHDKLIRSLLLVHGLHPQTLEVRLQEALGKIRPYLQSHGGNVELLRLENDVATLRLQGTCKTCPSSTITLELAVRQAIEQACPDLQGFEVEGVERPADSHKSLVCDQKILST